MNYKAALAALLLAGAAQASIFASLRGIVHDPDHRPIQGAQVTIQAVATAWSKTVITNSDGEFALPAAPLGAYAVTVASPGFAPMEQRITVASGASPVLHFQLAPAVLSQSVEVTEHAATVDPESAATTTLIGRRQMERTPGADRTNSLTMITNYVPGAYLIHDQLHVRGGHQVSWLVDGVPVPNTNLASNVGPQFDPKDADYIEVQRGGLSSEYGDRTYGVFNVVPRTGFERDNEAEVVASFGQFFQTNDQLSLGGHTERFAWYASANANRSDLGLETPTPDVRHDRADGGGAFSTLLFNLDQATQLRLVTSARRDRYQVPDTPDGQRESDAFVNFSWVHTAGPGLVLTLSPFYHFNRADYAGGSPDSPTDNRASTYAGAQASASATSRRHDARAGFYGFRQWDRTLFALPDLRQRQNLAGHVEVLFAEDRYKLTPWLTLSGGVRLTHFSGSLDENAASPRAGAALRIPRLNWTLRAFYGRYYQPPPLATISGPLADLAAGQGFDFLPLRGERDEQRQLGLTIPLRGWTADVDTFDTRARNFFDHEALGNSNIFFPLTIAGARIRGAEIALRSPRLFHRGEVHLAFSRQKAQGLGAVTGGLTEFEPPPDGLFLLDHDQRYTVSTGFSWNLPARFWAAGNVYYGSGFADENGPAHLPGHTTVDLSVGRTLGEHWSASVTALNAANRRYLLDHSPEFGGTHFGDPRQVYAQLKYRFRY